jgi:hypothetical protein
MNNQSSWKTTFAGVVSIVITVLTLIVAPMLDDDAETKPRLDEAAAIITAACIGLFSRDDDKSSEDVGVK